MYMHMHMYALYMVGFLLIAPASAEHVPGSVCAEVEASLANATVMQPAVDMLRGKHLRIAEMVWSPWAVKDETTPSGWSGYDGAHFFDISSFSFAAHVYFCFCAAHGTCSAPHVCVRSAAVDLVHRVSEILGFTYEFYDMGYTRSGETYTQMLGRIQNESDLIASFWGPYPERFNLFGMVRGHVDLAEIFMTRVDVPNDTPFTERFFSFLKPFRLDLWAIIIAMVFCSGLMDYLVERKSSGTASVRACMQIQAKVWGATPHSFTRASQHPSSASFLSRRAAGRAACRAM